MAAGKTCWTSSHKIHRRRCPSEASNTYLMAKIRSGRSGFYLQVLGFALGAFLLSFALNLSFEGLSSGISLGFSLPLFLFVLVLGVAGDVAGLASARAKEESLLAMASRKVPGAREAVWFVRNAPRVSSVFSDLVGDVSATLAGALAVAMASRLRPLSTSPSGVFLTSGAVGLASLLCVGGKALFKPLALKYAETIILMLGKTRRLWLTVLGGTTTSR